MPSRTAAVVGVMAVVTAGCWVYLVAVHAASVDTSEMGDTGSALAMPMTAAWTLSDGVLTWVMWAVMMAAMMLPSATPMVAAYTRTVRSPRSAVRGSTTLFVAGYVVLWSGFALLTTGAQWALHGAVLVDAMGVSTSRWLAGPVLVAAGAYQLTPLKHAMLARCRSPLSFLLHDWRDGRVGALVMGLHHAVLCLACCWALMALLFVLGVMNLWWIALLASTVLIEKVTRGDFVPRALGGVMIFAGVLVLLG